MREAVFVLKGLNCPNCAAKIEKGVNGLKGVERAAFNMINKEMVIRTDIEEEKLLRSVEKIVNKYEKGVEVLKQGEENHGVGEHTHKHSEEHWNGHIYIIRLVIGVAFLGAALAGVGGGFNPLIYAAAYIIFGYDVLLRAVKNIASGSLFDENFLMSLATVGAFVIGEYPEAAAVMLFYQIGEFFQDMAVDRSTRSIKELMNLMPEYMNLLCDNGEIKRLSPREAAIGDIIVIKNGERVPLDCKITKGESYLDTSALTGESKKLRAEAGSSILSGCINEGGVLYGRVEKTYENTTVKKIMDMVESASANKSEAESFITSFAKIYTPIVCLCALLLFAVPTILGCEWRTWLYRALIFLVSSCPCALVLSIPLTFFSGLGAASKKGVLIKGSNYIQTLAKLNTAVFDKTGTLTQGVFKVTHKDNEEAGELCAALERFSNHPIAAAVLESCQGEKKAEQVEEIRGMGLKGLVEGKTVIAGNRALMEEYGVRFAPCDDLGTIIYVAEEGRFLGSLTLSDVIKEDSRAAVELLNKNGIETVMLTGDKKDIAERVAAELGVKKVYSQLLPQDKVLKIEELYKEKPDRVIAFVGDGINDAPVLARADIGAAMGGIGSDAAIEAADVVIMNDQASKLYDGVKIAKSTMRLVRENTVFVLAVKLLVLALAAVGYANMWLAVFADVGVALLAVLNSLRKK